jgi:hypothetical protein
MYWILHETEPKLKNIVKIGLISSEMIQYVTQSQRTDTH